MTIIAMGVVLIAYQLGWYGYAVLQQPADGGCTGFVDLLLPSRASTVNSCIQNNWYKAKGTDPNWAPSSPTGGGYGEDVPPPNTTSANTGTTAI